MGLDEKQLGNTSRCGNPPTAVELVEQFYERIYGFLRRLTANDADAADLAQRAFSRAWQKLPTFAGHSSLASWIHSIAYHLYVDWRRANRHTEVRSDEWWASRPAGEPTPDEWVARTDMAAAIYASVDSLDSELRDTIHLHYYQELTLQETADAMDVALSTVKYRQRQALTELQKKLASDNPILKSPPSPK